MNYRNRDLLDLAYAIPCQFNLTCCEGGDSGEPAHSNQIRHGKGGSIKAHDIFFAAGCRSCHREIDQGNNMTRQEKFDAWQRAYESTMLELWRRGLIRVSN